MTAFPAFTDGRALIQNNSTLADKLHSDYPIHMPATQLYDRFAKELSTLGPVGFLPKAPGTWGSLAAVITAPVLFLPLDLPLRVGLLLLLFLIGGFTADRAESLMQRKDPGCVVIDEVLGQWATFLFLPDPSLWILALGFALFRIFDIAKPWPVRSSETLLPGGFGVMIDDVTAALYSGAILTAVHFWA
jgi:phosphatidylglycerophosphatase A